MKKQKAKPIEISYYCRRIVAIDRPATQNADGSYSVERCAVCKQAHNDIKLTGQPHGRMSVGGETVVLGPR